MVILVDTNVIIDFLMMRKPFGEAATRIIQKCADGEIKGYLAFHSLPNLWYVLRKVPEDIRREWLMDLCSFLEVAGTSHNEVVKAIANKEFKDFEDCLQDRCAKSVGAQYIITRNVKDFTTSDIPAISSEDFLKIMK